MSELCFFDGGKTTVVNFLISVQVFRVRKSMNAKMKGLHSISRFTISSSEIFPRILHFTWREYVTPLLRGQSRTSIGRFSKISSERL